MTQPLPQSHYHEQWLNRQPDLLTVAREALPYVEGLLSLHERTSEIEAWESTNLIVDRLKGAIAKETCRCMYCQINPRRTKP